MLIDIVSFHMDWQDETNSVDNVQCFTIREIEGIIRALAQYKNIYFVFPFFDSFLERVFIKRDMDPSSLHILLEYISLIS